MHRPGVLRQYSDRVRITSQTTTSRSIERFASDDVDDEDSERPMLDSRWSITSRCRRPNRYCRHTRKEPVAERHALQPWMAAGPGPCFCMRLYGPEGDLAGDAFQETLIGEEHRNRRPSAQTRRTH